MSLRSYNVLALSQSDGFPLLCGCSFMHSWEIMTDFFFFAIAKYHTYIYPVCDLSTFGQSSLRKNITSRNKLLTSNLVNQTFWYGTDTWNNRLLVLEHAFLFFYNISQSRDIQIKGSLTIPLCKNLIYYPQFRLFH